MNLKKIAFTLPVNVAESLPGEVSYDRVKPYLHVSSVSSVRRKLCFDHSKRVAFCYFPHQEPCSSGGKYSTKLMDDMIDRKRRGGYVVLPENRKLRAAEVYDGGIAFQDADVQCISDDGGKVHITWKPIEVSRPLRPRTPLSEKQRTDNLVNHLESFILQEDLPLSLKKTNTANITKLCRFSGGGDVTVSAKQGVVVIGGIYNDKEQVTPLKEGDVPTITSIEDKLPTNPMVYEETEKQLFASMHLSASEAMIKGLVNGEIDPSEVKQMIAYGTILKPGSNLVTLYKLVAEFNEKTYVQVDYEVETIYWHDYFNRVLLYMFDKLCGYRTR